MRSAICMVAVLACMGLIEETSARNSCSENQFQCDNGYCIPDRWQCDGFSDCSHGEDEYYCGTSDYYTESSAEPTCADDEYECWQGSCIPEQWVCDDYQDCPYGDDEEDCDSTGMTAEPLCPGDYYQCDYYGECIPHNWVCDGYPDCPFGTDEEDCYNSTTARYSSTTPPPQQECRDSFDYIYDRCVLVDPFTATNWDEARYLCEKFSSDLVVLNDYNFYAELLQYIRDRALDSHNYWVGATDRAAEGTWLWVDSSPVPSRAPLWALYGCTGDYQLEPRPSDAANQDCGLLDKDRGLYMSDASCDESFATICQAMSTKKETMVEEPIEKELSE